MSYLERLKLKIFLLFLAILMVESLNASVLINELMNRNLSSVINENFNYVSWVEIYNSGPEELNLSECVFLDDKGNVWESKLDKVLEPDSFFIFYFDELNVNNHVGFKLDSDGGELMLLRSNGMTLDYLDYPRGIRNVSYGRVVDGGNEWGYKSKCTPCFSNNEINVCSEQTQSPIFSLSSGFYKGPQFVLLSASPEAKIYYTTDGSEPQPIEENLYKDTIFVKENMPIRAVAVSDGFLSSEIVTNCYYIDERELSLPVVSLVSDPSLLYSDSIGMLVKGNKSNWTVSLNCGDKVGEGNYMEEWDRPMYFEYYDEQLVRYSGIELKSSISGNCSRINKPHSLKLKVNKTYSEAKKIGYNFFSDKPEVNPNSIILRNSGNDNNGAYLRDALLHSLVAGQMNIDYQSYLPSIVFVNGVYYGLMNIRERSNEDLIYSNYGYEEDEIDFPDQYQLYKIDCYESVREIYQNPNVNADGIYEKIDSLIDVDEFLNYFMVETYSGNTDWANNNVKLWRCKDGGKWRWILYDTDCGLGLFDSYDDDYSMHKADRFETFKRLIKNEKLAKKFITKNIIHMSTTFSPERVVHFIDSLSNRIAEEVEYFYPKVGKYVPYWRQHVQQLRTFANKRPFYQFANIGNYFALGDTSFMSITSNNVYSRYRLNGEFVNTSTLETKCFDGFYLEIKPLAPLGKVFSYWEITKTNGEEKMSYIDSSFVLRDTFTVGTSYKAVYRDSTATDRKPCEYLRINEICSLNTNLRDENGNYGDWIEIYNDADTSVSLSGLFITDNKNTLNKYQFPISETSEDSLIMVIPPKSYKILWADNHPERGPLHLNFALSNKESETISLSFDNDGYLCVLDSVHSVIHNDGESYALFENNGVYYWKKTSNITLGTQNQLFLVCPSKSETHKVYNGTSLSPVALIQKKNEEEEVSIEYSIDKGESWSADAPSINRIWEMSVTVRAVNPKYDTATCEYVLSFESPDVNGADSLRINEICTANATIQDEYGEFNGWIEIYNDAETSVSLSGLFISDSRDTLKKYQFPIPTTSDDSILMLIPPKSYKILWTDNQPEQGPLHLNFTLSGAEQKTLVLSYIDDSMAYVIDSVSFDIHEGDESFALLENDDDELCWISTSYLSYGRQNQLLLNCPSINETRKLFDGKELSPVATIQDADEKEEYEIEYSTDEGVTWSSIVPSITEVGDQLVMVRANYPNFKEVECEYTLSITDFETGVDMPYANDGDIIGDEYKVFNIQGKLVRISHSKENIQDNLLGIYLVCVYQESKFVSCYRMIIEK